MSRRKIALKTQQGLTLVELMVSLVISLLIVIAASSFYLGSGRTRATQEAASLLQDNARFATDLITKNIQQAGFQNYIYTGAGSSLRESYEISGVSDGEPDIRGYNNTAGGTGIDNGLHSRTTNRINNSDTLVLRFQGSGTGAGDGSMIDCLGRPQPAPTTVGDRAYSVFEVRQTSSSVEPELRCKYSSWASGVQTFTAEPVIRGVETLQFLYGVDSNADSFVDRWLNAAEVSPTGSTTVSADWKRVKSVRVGMVLRSPDRVTVGSGVNGTTTMAPLGINFSQSNGDTLVANTSDGRLRRVVTFTVNLRNAL